MLLAYVEVDEGKVKEIFDRLKKAQQEIQDCYFELEKMNVLKVKEAPTTENSESSNQSV